MLTFNLLPIFKARGIEKPFNFLIKAGFSSHTANSIIKSATRNWRLDQIELLCEKLNCSPNDLLQWTPNENNALSDSHPLTKLNRTIPNFDWQQTLKSVPLDKLNDIAEILKNQNTDKKE